MKNSQRKKIIIGYRYDPQCSSSQRLHQVQTIQDQFLDEYLPTDSVKKSFESDQKLIQKLRNENLLIKTQLQRLSQKAVIKSYQELLKKYQQLESENKSLRLQVSELQNTISSLEKQQKQRMVEMQKESKQQQQMDEARVGKRKFTFSSLGRQNSIEEFPQRASQKLTGYQQARISNTRDDNESIGHHRFYSQLLGKKHQIQNIYLRKQQEQDLKLNFNNNVIAQNQQQQWTAKFPRGIDPDYMYNDLRTVESEKSQQLESQIHLGYNFSFMPKPLKRNNIKTLQTLQSIQDENSKKVTFNNETNIVFSSSYKEMTSREVQTPNLPTLSQQSLYMQQNNLSEPMLGKLNGLKKLPNKRNRQQRTSNYSINISDN